jgi:hypothetical protein
LGTPKGGIASPILFNIYMSKFDEYILKQIDEEFAEKNKVEESQIEPNSLLYSTTSTKIKVLRESIYKLTIGRHGLFPYPFKKMSNLEKDAVLLQVKKNKSITKVQIHNSLCSTREENAEVPIRQVRRRLGLSNKCKPGENVLFPL